ncbi:MAG: SWIM zinc finger family protein [Polyangiaceae bacterium]
MARRSARYSSDDRFPPYVPVAERARQAAATVAKLKKKGQALQPVALTGRAISSTFWGKAWCGHLESLSDFESRLPRGRTYVRGGAVIHLALESGRIAAKVQGSSLYTVEIAITKLKPQRWAKVVKQCTGSIDSLVELLRGKLSDSVMSAVTNVETGLFPTASELNMSCSCPDWAGLCKHLAAVLYGVGARLDSSPELLFTLRGVDPSELVAEGAAAPASKAKLASKSSRQVLSDSSLADVFGIELEPSAATRVSVAPAPAPRTARAPAPIVKRRGASGVAEQAALVLAFVNSHPGLGVELIGKSLQLSSQELTLPIRKLVAMGSLVTVGAKRATKYFAAPPPKRGRPTAGRRRLTSSV